MKNLLYVILVIGIVIGTGYIVIRSNNTAPDPDVEEIPINQGGSSTDATSTSQNVRFLTYSNPRYDFSFVYPEGWALDVSADEKVVHLASKKGLVMKALGGRDGGVDIKFSVVQKNKFEPVSTKVGEISYDPQFKALVDTSVNPPRCLLQSPLGGVEGAIPAFMYGGSMMSDPAHFEYAMLADRDYMILVNEQTMPPENDATGARWAKLGAERDKVYTSFAFTNDVYEVFPNCTTN